MTRPHEDESDVSSDDEFFDPEEDDAPLEPPSPSWLTRTLSEKAAAGGERSLSPEADVGSPAIQSSGALDVSELAATMPSVIGVDRATHVEPGSDEPASSAPSPQPASPSSATSPRSDPDRHAAPSASSLDLDASAASASAPKEFAVEKVFRIKDLDTGQEFLVDEAAADSMMGGGVVSASRGDGKSPAAGGSPAKVRDLQTGRDLSMREFEESVGISPLMREVSFRERALEGTSLDDIPADRVGERAAASPTPPKTAVDGTPGAATRTKKPFGRNPARWFNKRVAEARASLTSSAAEAPRADGPGYAEDADEDPASRAIRAAAEAAGTTGEGTASGTAAKVHVNRKMYKEFTELRLVQTLHAHEDAVWTMKFSHAGEYLATAGQDRIVRVWALDRERADAEPASGSSRGNLRLKGQNLFREKPHREYAGHRGDVLDLCWSHTDWLLSSSMDKTVRLWYMTMDECLRIFSHQDFVTAIDFNPVNDKYFLSGSLDGKLRFWNIPDHRVADWVDIGEMVTAATFNSDGSVAVAGSYKGKCHFYGMDGVRFDYLTHLDVRNSRSKKTQGKKITGLTFMPGDDRKLLVTSNDSRIRVYDGYALACKYKGHKNDNLLIRASFSPGAEFIVCGSEDENVYVWSTINSFVPSINPIYTGYRRDKHSSYESFAAQSDISTVALFAPEEVRRARTGRAAAEVAAARASVKTDIQATPAAAALFKGAPVSPMMDAACRGDEADGAGDDGAAGDDRPSDGTRESRRTEGAADARGSARGSEEGGGAAEPRADPRAEARAEGERAFAAGMAIGQIIVTAGYSGEIRIYENVGAPRWL